ncbi:MAG TPA: tRNA uridine-5-carboxymethylaminomethyl(34) synthesis GTPase MnmE [Alphaproteobacteria bacterium]|jgi:tRNA modification GTPase
MTARANGLVICAALQGCALFRSLTFPENRTTPKAVTNSVPETIYALASAPGLAGVAVYRISGPQARDVFAVLCRRGIPPPRQAVRVTLHDAANGDALDDGLAIWFPAPASFTGEDVVELHLHGGRASIALALETLGGMNGHRLAEPGEFTKRAFIAGKLDLTAAEGLADLVAAETEAQRRQARRQLGGELGALYEGWRARLLSLLAYQEAAIDFVDEDLPPDMLADAASQIAALVADIDAHLADNRRGERLRDGISIVILGAPNAGKSSLLNALAQRDAAIVSSRAGTTRDVIEVHLDLGGWPVILADTAGLREAADEIEGEGVRRALARAADADVKLVLFDASAELDRQTIDNIDENTIVLFNKSDLATSPVQVAGRPALTVSALTGAGIAALLVRLQGEVARRMDLSGSPALTRQRHRKSLENCRDSLEVAAQAGAPELLAEELRQAAQALGRITGRVGVEDLLDKIFRDFCIGK